LLRLVVIRTRSQSGANQRKFCLVEVS
jgi:hypothetical protein